MSRSTKRSSLAFWVACSVVVAAAACSPSGTGTTLVVDVWSDLAVPGELDKIEVVIAGGALKYPFALGQGSGRTRLPVRVALIPGGDRARMFEVEAVGLHESVRVVSQAALISFVPGTAQHLTLFLGRNCVSAPACSSANTCQDGACVSRETAGRRGPFDPKATPRAPDAAASDAPRDGGSESSTGGDTRDAMSDGSGGDGPDASSDQAPPDSATDGGGGDVDAPTDPPPGDGLDAPVEEPIDGAEAAVDVPPDLPPDVLRGNGQACSTPSECVSGFCTDGVCCDAACDTLCRSCKLSGSEGTCTSIAPGLDPDSECADDGAMSCGKDGMCDGAGGCRRYVAGTTCGTASCTGSDLTAAPACDGAGGCVPGRVSSCAPFRCSGSACGTTCNGDGDCVAPATCIGGSCGKKALGTPCASGPECNSGNCVDGVCCDGACGGACQACNLSSSLGLCSPHPADTDPEDGCGEYTCDGASACRTACAGQPACTAFCKATNYCLNDVCVTDKASGTCAAACECRSGSCADGFCCDMACGGPCRGCNLLGMEGTCTPHSAGSDPENGCGYFTCNGTGACNSTCSPAGSCPTTCKANAYCTAAGCAADLGNGQACTAACQCGSGVCGTFYRDNDNDSYGAGAAFQFCGNMPPGGYATSNTDCNDNDGAFNPGATELPGDEIDQNCDLRELCFLDADNDTFRLTTTIVSTDVDCRDSQEGLASDPTGDCCDTDFNAKPGQTGWFTSQRAGCGGWDYNCNTAIDYQYREISMGTIACYGAPPCFADVGIGWIGGSMPPCGPPSAQYRTCNQTNCTTVTQNYIQGCH